MIIPFEPEHLLQITPYPEVAEEVSMLLGMAESLPALGPSWTLILDRPYLIAGFVMLHQGCAEVWGAVDIFISPAALRTALRFYRRLRDDLNLRRVQSIVQKGFQKGNRMARFFDMVSEGYMCRYGILDRDYERLAWVRPR